MPTIPLTHSTLAAIKRYDAVSLDGLEAEDGKNLLRQMLRLRRIEEALIHEYHPADEIRCPVHFCIGQESMPSALSLVAQPKDYVFSHHRSHGYYFGKNAPLKELFAELYGKETGASGGRAGSQDISQVESRFFSGAILVGAASIGVGAAFGIQMQKLPEIVFIGFGEACTEEGAFWEAMEFISAKRLPIVLICENNRYSTFSDQLKRLGKDNLSEKVRAFGIPTVQIFGNDSPLALRTIRQAADKAREGGGPTFIEAFTYRWCSHVGPEDDNVNNYRTAEEIAFWKENCPIQLLKEKLLNAGVIASSDLDRWEPEIAKEITDLFAFAKSSAFPKASDWRKMNVCEASPQADRLLDYEEGHKFDHNQEDTRITSY